MNWCFAEEEQVEMLKKSDQFETDKAIAKEIQEIYMQEYYSKEDERDSSSDSEMSDDSWKQGSSDEEETKKGKKSLPFSSKLMSKAERGLLENAGGLKKPNREINQVVSVDSLEAKSRMESRRQAAKS